MPDDQEKNPDSKRMTMIKPQDANYTDTSQANMVPTPDMIKTPEQEIPTSSAIAKIDTVTGKRRDKLALRDMLKQVDLHTKYYGVFIRNGVDTI